MVVLAVLLLAVVFQLYVQFREVQKWRRRAWVLQQRTRSRIYGPNVNCERMVTGKVEFECHVEWKITHA